MRALALVAFLLAHSITPELREQEPPQDDHSRCASQCAAIPKDAGGMKSCKCDAAKGTSCDANGNRTQRRDAGLREPGALPQGLLPLLSTGLIGEVEMKRLRMLLALGLLASALTSGPGCDSVPTGPDPLVAASPSPSPTPTPDPKTDVNSCMQVDLRVTGYNGAGNPDVIFGVGELFVVQANPLNEAGAVLPSNCRASTFATWIIGGSAPCQQFGDRFSTTAFFWCIEPGTLDLAVVHGKFRSVWSGRIIR